MASLERVINLYKEDMKKRSEARIKQLENETKNESEG